MSVIGQIVVESRRYSGWVDPRYPIGYWQAALAVTGDATGGSLAIDLVFQLGTTPFLNSQMYSVERFGINQGDTTDRDMSVRAVNMGGPSNTGFFNHYTVSTRGVIVAGAMLFSDLAGLPWFLATQRTQGITASLSLITTNNDGLEFVFEAEGYRWSPRSVLVDGGPQRPPTGLYRA